MRMSKLFLQTLRDTPAEAGSAGFQLLLRAGLLRPLGQGGYGFTPLGTAARRRVTAVARRALQAVGGQEVDLPGVQPAAGQAYSDLSWEKTSPPVRFRDRTQHEVVLSTSQETAILSLARGVVQSYRQLPLLLYQVWAPFRDEARTGGGLFGARESLLVDGYSLHTDGGDLADFYPHIQGALGQVFERCELNVLSVMADTEADVPVAHKLVWPCTLGEETLVLCDACGYAAGQAIARAAKTPPPQEDMLPMQDVETPDCKTIADLARFLNIPESRTAKALFLVAYIQGEGDRFVFAVVRGDTDLNEAKLKRVLGAETVGPATEAEIRHMGAEPGYGSPVGLEGVMVVVDDLVSVSPNLVAGANRSGYHTLNVNYGRDYQAAIVADITLAQAGDPCPECGAPLRVDQGIELARMQKMGDGLSRAMEVSYLDGEGQARPLVMGRYRLHVDRLLAAMAEVHHDEHGLIWPSVVAPYHVYLMTLGRHSDRVEAAAVRLHDELTAIGLDVLFDDRDERAGVKFNDADLLGLPWRVVVGERGLEQGVVELKDRRASEVEAIPLEGLARWVREHMAWLDAVDD
ncbi:MAG: proline--tRNA ligase [Anaerolineae bacterium]